MTTQNAVPVGDPVAEALANELDEWQAACCEGHADCGLPHRLFDGIIAALRRLQAAQREPVAWRCKSFPSAENWEVLFFDSITADVWCSDGNGQGVCEPLYTHPQRDDHPTEGLLREVRQMRASLIAKREAMFGRDSGQERVVARYYPAITAALSPVSPPPDLEHPRSRETAAESLSVDTSVADQTAKNAARYEWLRENPIDVVQYKGASSPLTLYVGAALDAAIDAAMSADVRSQAKDTQDGDRLVCDEHDETKGATMSRRKSAVKCRTPGRYSPGCPCSYCKRRLRRTR